MASEYPQAASPKETAYGYLCHVEEAKRWLEEVIGTTLPPATQLVEELQNGVVLCQLGMVLLPSDPVWKCVYDADQSKYKKYGLAYRHTDNISFFISSLPKLGLPKAFHPVIADIYEGKHMPKLIYCLHALSHLLKSQGKVGQGVSCLYGRALFSENVISETRKALDSTKLPVFNLVENLVQEELQYQDLGFFGSIDETTPLDPNDPNSTQQCSNGGGVFHWGGKQKREEEREEEEGESREVEEGKDDEGQEIEPHFDNPIYNTRQEVHHASQRNGAAVNGTESKDPLAIVCCRDNTIKAYLYAKKARQKKSYSIIDKAADIVNRALDSDRVDRLFLALRNIQFPFACADHQEQYMTELKRERRDGIPGNVLIVYSQMARELCRELLEKMNPGAYIVRTSGTVHVKGVIFSFRNHTGIKHWQLNDRNGKYYWGERVMCDTLEDFIDHFVHALSQATHLHVYPGLATKLQPQFHTTEEKRIMRQLRAGDGNAWLTYGQICQVVRSVNSEERHGRKEPPGQNHPEMVMHVNRLQAEQILAKEGSPGSFLVRPSEKTLGDFALAFRTANEIRHWKIEQKKEKFYVHPRPNPYNSLEEIIQHFQEAVGQETGLVMSPLLPSVTVATTQEDCDPSQTPSDSPVCPASPRNSTIGRNVGPSASLSKLNPANLTSWSVEDVSQWLTENSLGQFVDIFSENLIDGDCLMSLTNGQLKEDLGITALGHRSRIMKRVHELKVMMHPSLS